MRETHYLKLSVMLALLCTVPVAQGDFMDFFKKVTGTATNSTTSVSGGSAGTIAGLAQEEITRGLKEALGKAVQKAVAD